MTEAAGRSWYRITLPMAVLYLMVVTVGNLAWEIIQLPLYTIGQSGTWRDQTFAVVHCTAGDLLISAWTLILAVLLSTQFGWPVRGEGAVALVTIVIGVAYTFYSEWQNVYVVKTWDYAPGMPRIVISSISIGLAPLVQWMVIPTIGFWAVHQRLGRVVQAKT